MGPQLGAQSAACSPVKWEQLAVTEEGIAAEVNQLQLAETKQGGQGLQLVLLQVQAPEPGPQAGEGPWSNLQGVARSWCELLSGQEGRPMLPEQKGSGAPKMAQAGGAVLGCEQIGLMPKHLLFASHLDPQFTVFSVLPETPPPQIKAKPLGAPALPSK